MAKVSPARRAALRVLGDVRRRNAHARDLLRSSAYVENLDSRDRALVTRLALGVVGSYGLLDACIDAHLAKGAKLEPQVRDALRLATYELLFLATPPQIAASQGVELVRSVRPRVAGLANAVLRRVALEDVPRRERAIASPSSVDDLSLVSGYPAWLLERVPNVRDLAFSATDPAPVYVATNRARYGDDETLAMLRDAGLDPVPCDVPGSFELRRQSGFSSSGLIERADVVVADLSAQRVASLVGPSPSSCVLEVGQGRGTKSILLESAAMRAGGLASIVGVDTVPFKVKVATERMVRAGLVGAVECLEFDACDLSSPDLPALLQREFDVVFVDAPCSGTGTLRRHPEIAWSLTPSDVDGLADLQLRMLLAASQRVAAGGTLCYATCSVLEQENSKVVEAFLDSEQGARFELRDEPMRMHPTLAGPDGHFAAVMLRRDTKLRGNN